MPESRRDMGSVAQVVSLLGNARMADVALSTTAAQSAALNEGVYDLWSTADTYIKVATTATDVTTTTGYLIRANTTVPFYVPQGAKIGGILASGTGTLSGHGVSWFA